MQLTVCKNGHPFVEGNIRLETDGRRCCLICYRRYQKEYQLRRLKGTRSLDRSEEARFEFYCCYTGDCIVWTGAADKLGYGKFSLPGGKMIRAYRYAYEKVYGPIPPGLEPDHICRNPPCVAAGHLEAVTHQVNVQRGNAGKHLPELSRERAKLITHCPKGHEYNEENTYYRAKGYRQCRVCSRDANNRRYRASKG